MFLNVHYKDVLKVQNKEHDYYSLQINDRFQFDCNNATDLLIPCTLIFESVHWAFTHKALSAIILNMVAQCRGAARISVRRCFFCFFVFLFFSVRLLSVLCGHLVFSSPPQRPMTSDFEGFSIPDFIHNIYFPILILEKESVFSF